MSALITTRSPTSYQLRSAAVNCRKYPSPSTFLRMHVHKLDYQIHCFCSYNNNVSKQRKNSKFYVNAFSGWSGDDNGTEVLNESKPKKESSGGSRWCYCYLMYWIESYKWIYFYLLELNFVNLFIIFKPCSKTIFD